MYLVPFGPWLLHSILTIALPHASVVSHLPRQSHHCLPCNVAESGSFVSVFDQQTLFFPQACWSGTFQRRSFPLMRSRPNMAYFFSGQDHSFFPAHSLRFTYTVTTFDQFFFCCPTFATGPCQDSMPLAPLLLLRVRFYPAPSTFLPKFLL